MVLSFEDVIEEEAFRKKRIRAVERFGIGAFVVVLTTAWTTRTSRRTRTTELVEAAMPA